MNEYLKFKEIERKRRFMEQYILNRAAAAFSIQGCEVVNEAEITWNRLEELIERTREAT